MICQYSSEQNVKFLLEGGEVFLKEFLSGTVAENLAVHGVDGPCHDITVILCPMGQGFTLTEVAADQAVGVLIASPL